MMRASETEGRPQVERALTGLFAAGDPDPTFVLRLELQLRSEAAAQVTGRMAHTGTARPAWRTLLPRQRLAVAVLAIVLALIATVSAVGPGRVLADIQRLFRYVPGIGFVNLQKTRVLAAPVEVARGGVTLRVTQVVAGPERTQIVLSTEGLPREDQVRPAGTSLLPPETVFAGQLRLPDGTALVSNSYTLRWGGGSLEFPALPADVYTATLELARLPLVPAGVAPENWQIHLVLQPADGPLAAALYPQPDQPAVPGDTHHGITIRVEDVAYTANETVVKVRAQWEDPSWEMLSIGGGGPLPVLRDDVGHIYGWAPSSSSGSMAVRAVVAVPMPTAGPTPLPQPPSTEQTIAFAPLSVLAREVTLEIEGIQVEVRAGGQFQVTIPEGTAVGDQWPLDLRVDVAGFPVHITGARLYEETLTLRDGPMIRTVLSFDVAEVPEQDGKRLAIFHIDSASPSWQSGPGSFNVAEHRMSIGLALLPGHDLPSGAVNVSIRGASVVFRGPWSVHWTVGGRAGDTAKPISLRPASATDSHGGLTLQLLDAITTDRLTALRMDLKGAPEGVRLGQLRSWNPQTGRNELYLDDSRGNRLDYGNNNTRWAFPGETSPLVYRPQSGAQTLVLSPVGHLARHVTLSLPAIEVIRPEAGTFDVVVPAGVELKAQPDGRPRASDPWEVKVAFEAGGYAARFTHAQLLDRGDFSRGNSVWLVFSPALGSDSGKASLSGLCDLRFTSPSGRDARAGKDVIVAESGPCAATLSFEVTDPVTGSVEAGVYHAAFSGIAEAVPGPWRLAWDLPGR